MSPATTKVDGRGLARLSTDELRRRRGELAQGMQMAALEGLPVDAADLGELASLDDELRRRGAASR